MPLGYIKYVPCNFNSTLQQCLAVLLMAELKLCITIRVSVFIDEFADEGGRQPDLAQGLPWPRLYIVPAEAKLIDTHAHGTCFNFL
jgi:hypothetical protein